MPHHLTPGEPGHGSVHGPRRRRVAVHALLVPADPARPCELREPALTAASLSDAIGGGLLDELLIETTDGLSYCVYADADRLAHGLPENTRGVALAARLGWIDLVDRFHPLGDLLFVGSDSAGNDTDVPHLVIEAARRTGLFPCFREHG